MATEHTGEPTDRELPYNSAYGTSGLLADGPVIVDYAGSASGGDMPGARPSTPAQHGSRSAAGRVEPEVVRVTLTQSGVTVDGVLANGTLVGEAGH